MDVPVVVPALRIFDYTASFTKPRLCETLAQTEPSLLHVLSQGTSSPPFCLPAMLWKLCSQDSRCASLTMAWLPILPLGSCSSMLCLAEVTSRSVRSMLFSVELHYISFLTLKQFLLGKGGKYGTYKRTLNSLPQDLDTAQLPAFLWVAHFATAFSIWNLWKVAATQEVEAGGFVEPRRWTLAWAPQHEYHPLFGFFF